MTAAVRTLVTYDNPDISAFALAVLTGEPVSQFEVRPRPDANGLEVSPPLLAVLLQRLADGQPTVLPRLGSARDYWILVGGTRNQLERTLHDISRFIIPTYGEFGHGQRAPLRRSFDAGGSLIHTLGAQLYPDGYHRWEASVDFRDNVLAQLQLWLDLTSRRPLGRREPAPAYRDELRAFESALAAADWDTAEQTMERVRRANLTTADNLDFLTVALLAQQQRWRNLWTHPDYERIARLRMPRAVRAALLTAFHASVLLPYEIDENWESALAEYRRCRARLGQLLTTRAGLSMIPVLDVFAFEAAFAGDASAFAVLTQHSGDPSLSRTLEALAALVPSLRVAPPTEFPKESLDLAREALFEGNYDVALSAINQLDQPTEHALLLVELAFRLHAPEMAERAVLQFWELSQETQETLLARHPSLQHQLEWLLALSSPPAMVEPPTDWNTLLTAIDVAPERPDLPDALERLIKRLEDHVWTADELTCLSGQVLTLLGGRNSGHSITRRTVDVLIDSFLRDSRFPRSDVGYTELYDTFYTWLFELAERNAVQTRKLLRLAEAMLHHHPSHVAATASDLLHWFDPPRAALEEQALDAFELLAEHGYPAATLVEAWRGWVVTLLGLPASRDHAALTAWLTLGDWMKGGADLLEELRIRLQESGLGEEASAIARLRPGFRIGIFTLRPGSAAHVRASLLLENPQLDIRICASTDLDDQTKALALSADMPVVVTTCISHALTYGIGPYLQTEPVYPVASGSSGILRAITARARSIAAAGVA